MGNRDALLSKLLDENKIALLHGAMLNTKPYKMFLGWNIKFQYEKEGTTYLFQWQHWNWIDMYDGDKRLYEVNNALTINGSEIKDKENLIDEMNQCIDRYRDAKKHIDQQN